jgi:hypothetical protein
VRRKPRLRGKSQYLGKTILEAVDSLDGFIADDGDGVGPLFDWYGNGDVGWSYDGSTSGALQIGGQALTLGLVNELVVNLAPVVFGSGKP